MWTTYKKRKGRGRGRGRGVGRRNGNGSQSEQSKLNVILGEPMDANVIPPLPLRHEDKKEKEEVDKLAIDEKCDGEPSSSKNGDLERTVNPGGVTEEITPNAAGGTIDHESENPDNELEGISSPGDNACSVMELIRSRFNIDDSAPSSDDGDSDDMFPPSNFDFESVLEEIERQLEEEGELDDDAECISEILRHSEELERQFKFHIPKEEILADYESTKAQLKFPPRPSAAERKKMLEKFDPLLNANETSSEKCCQGSSKTVILAGADSNPDVIDKQLADNKIHQLALVDKGNAEGRDESFERANLQEDMSTQKISFANNHDKLQKNMITNGNQNLSSCPTQSEIPAQAKVQIATSPEMHVTSNLGEVSDGISAPLSDLQTQKLIKRKVSQTATQIDFSTTSASTVVHKQSTSNSEDIVNLASPTSALPVSNGMIPADLIISPVSPTKDDWAQNHQDSPEAPPRNLASSIVEQPSPELITISSSSSSHSEDEQNSTQSENEWPVIIGIKSLKQTDPLFRCKFCGENYFCYDDDLFKKHVFLKHRLQITEDQYFDESRISTSTLSECSNCGNYVLKIGQHNMKCKGVCNLVEIEAEKLLKHGCGICKEHFSARYELKRHMKQYHVINSDTDTNCKKLWRKIICNPGFQCAQCLKGFDNTFDLTRHCSNCIELSPTPETIQELAQSYFQCDLCNTKHSSAMKIRECYFGKKIFRCALCFDMFYDKRNFRQHLHDYHDLEVQGDDEKPKLTFPCPLCIDKVQRGKYQEIFPHIVADHYQPIFDAMNQITVLSSSSIQEGQMEALSDRQPIASQNQNSKFSNPILATSTTTHQVHNHATIIADSIEVRNPANSPPAEISTTTARPPAAGATTSSSVSGGKTTLLEPPPTPSSTGGSKSIHLPLQHPACNALGNILQGGFKSPRTLKPTGSATTARTIRFLVKTPNHFLRPMAITPRVPAPAAFAVPKVPNSKFSSATAVTATCPDSSVKTTSQKAPNVSNQRPITGGHSAGFKQATQSNKRIKLTEADATSSQK